MWKVVLSDILLGNVIIFPCWDFKLIDAIKRYPWCWTGIFRMNKASVITADGLGPPLLTLKSFYLKAFSRKHGCDWLKLLWQNMEAPVSIFQESPLAGEPRERLFHIHSVNRYQLRTK